MNTTTSPQVGKGTLRDAGILEQDEPDDNVRYGQSISMKTGGTGNSVKIEGYIDYMYLSMKTYVVGVHTRVIQ